MEVIQDQFACAAGASPCLSGRPRQLTARVPDYAPTVVIGPLLELFLKRQLITAAFQGLCQESPI